MLVEKYHADVNAQDIDGRTPVDYVEDVEEKKICAYLMDTRRKLLMEGEAEEEEEEEEEEDYYSDDEKYAPND